MFSDLSTFVQQIRFQDFVDLTIVWFLVYRILLLTKRSGAVQILSGLGILATGYLFSIWFEFYTFNWILDKFFSNLFLILVILFQAEIRRTLAQIGSVSFFSSNINRDEKEAIDEIIQSLNELSQKGFGALMVFEKDIALDYYVDKGTVLNSEISSELLNSIFHVTSPLHDGAVLVRGNKVLSAGSFLPLSTNPDLSKTFGTRHRAALGLAEQTDAMVVVVSEETRKISIAQGGLMQTDLGSDQVRRLLYQFLNLKVEAPKKDLPA
jgi:diadenylate cyclase